MVSLALIVETIVPSSRRRSIPAATAKDLIELSGGSGRSGTIIRTTNNSSSSSSSTTTIPSTSEWIEIGSRYNRKPSTTSNHVSGVGEEEEDEEEQVHFELILPTVIKNRISKGRINIRNNKMNNDSTTSISNVPEINNQDPNGNNSSAAGLSLRKGILKKARRLSDQHTVPSSAGVSLNVDPDDYIREEDGEDEIIEEHLVRDDDGNAFDDHSFIIPEENGIDDDKPLVDVDVVISPGDK